MANPNNFPGTQGGTVWGFVTNSDDDVPQDRSSAYKIMRVDASAAGCDPGDLPFSGVAIDPSGVSQMSSGHHLAPGTPVLMATSQGNPGGIVVSVFNSLFNSESGSEGGGTNILSSNPHFQAAKNKTMNVRMPPRIRETQAEDGTKIREAQETGEQFSLSTLEGLPLHASLFEMSGFRLPEISKVPTAIKKNDGMMMVQQLQQMMGQVMSLGQMFAGLAGNKGAGGGGGGFPNGFGSSVPIDSAGKSAVYNYDPQQVAVRLKQDANTGNTYGGSQFYSANNRLISIQNRVPSEMALAIGNLAKHIQGLELNNGVAFFTGGVVHESTYLQNAENLLAQVTSMDELMNVLSRLQYDESLFGREHLRDVYVTIDTSHGPMTSVVDFTGNVYVRYTSAAMNTMNSFANSFVSNTASPAIGSVPHNYFAAVPAPPSAGTGTSGASSGQGQGQGQGGGSGNNPINVAGLTGMFSRSAQVMQDMIKRLHPEGEKKARQLYRKVNEGEESQKLFEINKKTLNEGNPFEGGDFNKTGFSVSFLE